MKRTTLKSNLFKNKKELLDYIITYNPIIFHNMKGFEDTIISQYNIEDLLLIKNILSSKCIFNIDCDRSDKNFNYDSCTNCRKNIESRFIGD